MLTITPITSSIAYVRMHVCMSELMNTSALPLTAYVCIRTPVRSHARRCTPALPPTGRVWPVRVLTPPEGRRVADRGGAAR